MSNTNNPHVVVTHAESWWRRLINRIRNCCNQCCDDCATPEDLLPENSSSAEQRSPNTSNSNNNSNETETNIDDVAQEPLQDSRENNQHKESYLI